MQDHNTNQRQKWLKEKQEKEPFWTSDRIDLTIGLILVGLLLLAVSQI